jgi:hypothetical protein
MSRISLGLGIGGLECGDSVSLSLFSHNEVLLLDIYPNTLFSTFAMLLVMFLSLVSVISDTHIMPLYHIHLCSE